ncbi:MAG: hypothetical protein LC808_25700 [Actinobacteria bacterium]|nr:hypothetical protein [Actinomycetota bacterium]
MVNIYDRNAYDSNGFSLALARDVPIDEYGEFSVVVQMPQTAALGSHQIDGQCFDSGEYASAIFTATPPPTLTLDPSEGKPGEKFTVAGSGYSPCRSKCLPPKVQIIWDTNEEIGTAEVDPEGNFSVDVAVPQTAVPGDHQVVGKSGTESDVESDTESGIESAEATFTALPSPTLNLYPDEGRPGALFEVEGHGYSPCTSDGCPPVEVFWGANNEKIGTGVMGYDGGFSVDVNVPRMATPGSHSVVGRFGGERASKNFTVESSPVDLSVLDLNLIPREGHPGDPFKVEGSGYNECPDRGNRVVNIYDRNIQDGNGRSLALARNVPIGDQGRFSVNVQMPSTAVSGGHEIVGRCFDGGKYDSEFFTVIDPTPGLTGPGTGPLDLPPGPFDLPDGPLDLLPGSVPPDPQPGQPDPPPGQPDPPPGSASGDVERAYLATQVLSPIDVFDDPLQLLLSLLLVGLLVLVVAFPADLFNSTFENNRDEINGWFSWVPRPPRLNLPSWVHLDILGLVAAFLLLMAVVRNVGLNYATLAQAVGFLIAVPLVVVALEAPRGWYYRRKNNIQTHLSTQAQRRQTEWRVLPAALIVAGFLALVSRLADFEPPYVYGLIAVYIGADLALNNRDAAGDKERGTLIGILFLFAVSIIAWFSWIPVDRVIDSGQRGFGWLVLDAMLATFFLLGLEAAVFGLIPLTFLKGKDIFQWRPAIWAATFALIAYFFINFYMAALVGENLTLTLAKIVEDPGKIIKAVVLFLAFGIFSVLFWGYFHPRFRPVRRWWSRLVHQ